MSAAAVKVETTKTDSNLEFKLRPTPPDIDPNIDDPVNDTGLGPYRGDLQVSDEFACMLKVICADNGEF